MVDEGKVQEMIRVSLDHPPEELVAMRSLLGGQLPRNERERFLKGWMEKKPAEFMAAKARLEGLYRSEQKLKLAAEGTGAVVAEEVSDASTEELIGMMDEWLAKHGEGGRGD